MLLRPDAGMEASEVFACRRAEAAKARIGDEGWNTKCIEAGDRREGPLGQAPQWASLGRRALLLEGLMLAAAIGGMLRARMDCLLAGLTAV